MAISRLCIMSKRCGKSKKQTIQGTGVRTTQKGKEMIKINWSEYNKKREVEGDNYDKWMRKIADKAPM